MRLRKKVELYQPLNLNFEYGWEIGQLISGALYQGSNSKSKIKVFLAVVPLFEKVLQ